MGGGKGLSSVGPAWLGTLSHVVSSFCWRTGKDIRPSCTHFPVSQSSVSLQS